MNENIKSIVLGFKDDITKNKYNFCDTANKSLKVIHKNFQIVGKGNILVN